MRGLKALSMPWHFKKRVCKAKYCSTWKLVELLLFSLFQLFLFILNLFKFFLFIFRRFLLISAVKSLKKLWNEQKRLKNGWKKGFNQLLGAPSTRKLVEIHNIYFLASALMSIPFLGWHSSASPTPFTGWNAPKC